MYEFAVIAVKDAPCWHFLKQRVDLAGHQISPIHYVAVLTNFLQKLISISSDESRLALHRKKYVPRLNNYCFILGQSQVRSWCYLKGLQHSNKVPVGNCKSEVLENIMRVFPELFVLYVIYLDVTIDNCEKLLIQV